MINEASCTWLMDQADISIRTQVARDILLEKSAVGKYEKELLTNEEVQKWLVFLKPMNPPQRFFMEHGSMNFHLEVALPKLSFLGLNGTFPEVRDAVEFYLERIRDSEQVKNYFGNFAGTELRYRSGERFHTILSANLLSFAGIQSSETDEYMLGSLNEMSRFTSAKDYDIYLSEEERKKLKNVPKCWQEKQYFIRPDITKVYGFSYPLIYDLIGLQSLYKKKEKEINTEIESVLCYIMTDNFHKKITDGYGILIEEDGSYHAMGWTPKFPGWLTLPSDEGFRGNELLFFALFASKYPMVRKSAWFRNFLLLTEKYRTSEGRFCFPAEWLKEGKGYAVNGSHMSFGENRRKKNWREIEATFYMQLIANEMS